MPNKLLGSWRHAVRLGRAVSGSRGARKWNITVCGRASMSFQPKEIGKRPRQRVEQAELDRIVLSHERFQAGRPGGQRAVLSYMDLARLDLVGKNLANATRAP